MLRRVGSASAPNVRSSDTYLGMWLTIRGDIEPVNSACLTRPRGAVRARAVGSSAQFWRLNHTPPGPIQLSPSPQVAIVFPALVMAISP